MGTPLLLAVLIIRLTAVHGIPNTDEMSLLHIGLSLPSECSRKNFQSAS